MYRKKAKWGTPKLTISGQKSPQEVTGLLVNSKRGPSVSKRRRDKVRAAVHGLKSLSGNELERYLNSTLEATS